MLVTSAGKYFNIIPKIPSSIDIEPVIPPKNKIRIVATVIMVGASLGLFTIKFIIRVIKNPQDHKYKNSYKVQHKYNQLY